MYHIHISAKSKWYNLNWHEIWKYRDLIMLFTRRNFILTFKQTILGPIWIFLNPFLTSIIYTFVFGNVAGISTAGVPQVLFYLCSNALWGFFAECVNKNAGTFVNNSELFGKVYFPRLTVPISNVFSSLIRFGVQMILVVMIWLYFVVKGVVQPNYESWWLILVSVFQLGILGLGIGIVISSFTTKYRDLFILVGFGIQLWMYATPVVYPLEQLSDGIIKTIILLNPVTVPIEMFRYAVFGCGEIYPVYMIFSWSITIVILTVGLSIFNYVERTFIDTV